MLFYKYLLCDILDPAVAVDDYGVWDALYKLVYLQEYKGVDRRKMPYKGRQE